MLSERPLVLLKKNYTSLSSHQKAIADFILANIDRVSGLVQLVFVDILFVTVSLYMEPESSQRIQMSCHAIASEKKDRQYTDDVTLRRAAAQGGKLRAAALLCAGTLRTPHCRAASDLLRAKKQLKKGKTGCVCS